MPIYEYSCEKCGKFEFLHGVNEGALSLCPKCGSPVRKLVPSRMGIAFNGPGFYVTDNRSEEYKREARKDRESSSSAS